MKILVTGGAGFIGSHLVDKLVMKKHDVLVVDNLANGKIENLIENIDRISFIEGSVCDLNFLQKVCKNIDVIYHLAGLADIVPSIENPNEYFEVNVSGTKNIFELARLNDVKQVIYTASSTCYGFPKIVPTPETAEISPQYPYALTKWMGEEFLLKMGKIYGIPITSLRLFNVFGPRSRTSGTYGAVFGVFLAQLIAKKPLTIVGDGNQSRDFTYVSDVVDALELFSLPDNFGTTDVYNIGSGGTYTINKLAELLGGTTEFIPKRPGEPDVTFADISKIKNKFKWKPNISFEEGVGLILKQKQLWSNAPVWDSQSIEIATRTWFKYMKNSNL